MLVAMAAIVCLVQLPQQAEVAVPVTLFQEQDALAVRAVAVLAPLTASAVRPLQVVKETQEETALRLLAVAAAALVQQDLMPHQTWVVPVAQVLFHPSLGHP
jgi:hypothetical protein